MVDFSDLDDFESAAVAVGTSTDEIRKSAHVVNGGEKNFPCPACHGSGYWRAGRHCFKCAGDGKVTARVAGAAKAKVTRANNFADWCNANRELLMGLERHTWNSFLSGMLHQVKGDGHILSEKQIIAATDAIARYDLKNAEREAARTAEREAAAKDVGIEAINLLFETAINSGLKAPKFRTERLEIKVAKLHADTLYVTDEGEYVGKIVTGKFYARREAKADVAELLCEIAKDPQASAVAYGRATGKCGCCGRDLSDPVSVEMGIGPICAEKWGF